METMKTIININAKEISNSILALDEIIYNLQSDKLKYSLIIHFDNGEINDFDIKIPYNQLISCICATNSNTFLSLCTQIYFNTELRTITIEISSFEDNHDYLLLYIRGLFDKTIITKIRNVSLTFIYEVGVDS